MENHSTEKEHTVKGNLRVDTVTYTGKIGEYVKRTEFSEVLLPMTKREVRMDVSFDEYYGRLVDQVIIVHNDHTPKKVNILIDLNIFSVLSISDV